MNFADTLKQAFNESEDNDRNRIDEIAFPVVASCQKECMVAAGESKRYIYLNVANYLTDVPRRLWCGVVVKVREVFIDQGVECSEFPHRGKGNFIRHGFEAKWFE